MRKIITLLWLLFAGWGARAQDKNVSEWEAHPQVHTLPVQYNNESAVIIKEEKSLKCRLENQNLWTYQTVHRIVQVMDTKGIEAFNKIIIPIRDLRNVQNIKARTILKSGKIFEVTQDKIKSIKNEEGNNEYLFAMEGVEVGAEVELLYTQRKPFSYFGTEIYQYNIPILEAEFWMSTPDSYIFETKGYNGFPNTKDTIISGTKYYSAIKKDIPSLDEETYSNYKANVMRLEYKLSYLPKSKGDARLLTWRDLVKELYQKYYTFTKKETKAVNKYLEVLGVNDADNEETKIKKIEEGLKTNIIVNNNIADDEEGLEKVIKTKTSSTQQLARLFTACFTVADVKNEFGLSSNREEHPLDEDFENWNWLEEYVIYFPNLKKFLSPSSIYQRYPITPTLLHSNKGIFCKPVTLGDITAPVPDIIEITPIPFEQCAHNIDADVLFAGEDLDPTLTVEQTITGYNAVGIREVMVLLPQDKLKEAITSIINIADNQENLLDYKIENVAFSNYSIGTPLKISAHEKTPQLMEKAGNKYLFKVGDVIGRQTELYQTKERRLPIDIPFAHSLNRTINIHIPTGYTILNPETVRIQTEMKDTAGKVSAGFISDYKMTGDKMVVSINEFYKQIHYPISEYDNFRKVINASADFNKVVLVLVKQ